MLSFIADQNRILVIVIVTVLKLSATVSMPCTIQIENENELYTHRPILVSVCSLSHKLILLFQICKNLVSCLRLRGNVT